MYDRYSHVVCPECSQTSQRIDYRHPMSHRIGCSVPAEPPSAKAEPQVIDLTAVLVESLKKKQQQ